MEREKTKECLPGTKEEMFTRHQRGKSILLAKNTGRIFLSFDGRSMRLNGDRRFIAALRTSENKMLMYNGQFCK